MLRLRDSLKVVDIGDGFDVLRDGYRTPLVSFYPRTGNVYVMHGSGNDKQILSSVPADEWQQRAHDSLVSRGWESPWEVCELRLREGFVEKPPYGGENVGRLLYKRGMEGYCEQYVFLDARGDVVAFPDGGQTCRVFRTIEEAHAWFIEQGSESPWEWVPVSATLDQADELRAFLNDYMNGNLRPRIEPPPLATYTVTMEQDSAMRYGAQFELCHPGEVTALRARVAELESTIASLTEKIDKARSILS